MSDAHPSTPAPAGNLLLDVVSPRGSHVHTAVQVVQATSVSGDFAVLAGHRPLLVALRPGLLRYRDAKGETQAAIGAGFAEVEPDRVRVVADVFVSGEEADADKAQQEREAAAQALADFEGHQSGAAFEAVQRHIDWAQALSNLAQHS
ncbi:MAG: ATP synthase F1 subunit epsilon [Polyangiales bacterium]